MYVKYTLHLPGTKIENYLFFYNQVRLVWPVTPISHINDNKVPEQAYEWWMEGFHRETNADMDKYSCHNKYLKF